MSSTAEKIAELKHNILTLEAFERGETVQYLQPGGDWMDDNKPLAICSEPPLKIRIKPKPVRYIPVGYIADINRELYSPIVYRIIVAPRGNTGVVMGETLYRASDITDGE